MLSGDVCSPGRVSWVHFTHAKVVALFQDKPEGYALLNV